MPLASECTRSNTELFAIEDGLIKVYELRKAADFPTSAVEEAYRIVQNTLATRGLFAKGIGRVTPFTPGKNDPDGDGDNDDQEGAMNNTGAGVGESEARGKGGKKGSEAQKPDVKVPQVDGPTVKKAKPPTKPGPWTKDGTKTGQGGNAHRFLAEAGKGDSPGQEDGDPDNTGETDWLKDAKAKRNKSPDPKRMGKAFPVKTAAPKPTAASPNPPMGSAPGVMPPDPSSSSSSGSGDMDNDDNGDDDGDAGDGSAYSPHPFVPSESIRSICDSCGRPIADHVGKALSADDSWEYVPYVIKTYTDELVNYGASDPETTILIKADFTPEQRQSFAQNGVALPDGSFPIPDEASLHNAVRLVGHANDPQQAMAHTIERAKTMGMTHALPPAWNVPDAGDHSNDPDPAPGPGAHSMAPATPVSPVDPRTTSPAGTPVVGQPAPVPGQPVQPGMPPKPKPLPGGTGAGIMKTLATQMKKGYDAGLDVDATLECIASATADTFEMYAVTKSDERRYTMGPVYMPESYDAHGEWTTSEELQKATWDYVRATGADRNVFLQHTDKPAGHWVEVMQWPYAVNATMQKSINGVTKAVSMDLPAGTVYMGVQWDDWAWDLVKKERITGFSMGGWAKRLEAEIESYAA